MRLKRKNLEREDLDQDLPQATTIFVVCARSSLVLGKKASQNRPDAILYDKGPSTFFWLKTVMTKGAP